MNKIYFIDSENVGDNWISLLNTVAPDDEILVFYTARSPHMNYKNLILLKQSPKEITFIECCEGNNALDFQLCTDLGYRVRDLGEAEFIIVSNDTGFDAVVKYWVQRSKCVRRIPGKACATVNLTKQNVNANTPARRPMHDAHIHEPVQTSVAGDASAAVSETLTGTVVCASPGEPVNAPAAADTTATVHEPAASTDAAATVYEPAASTDAAATVHEPAASTDAAATVHEPAVSTDAAASAHEPAHVSEPASTADVLAPAASISAPEPKHTPETIDFRAKEILFIIGRDNLQLLHLALQQIFGTKKGKIYYNAFKSDNAYVSYISKHKSENTKEKLNTYCSIVFELSEEKLEMPEDFPDFAIGSWKNKKNLNSFKSALQGKYGKELSDKYYSMFKTHIKILDKIK